MENTTESAPAGVRILGGVTLPGAESAVLERMLAAYRALGQHEFENLWQLAQAMPESAFREDVRVWWRLAGKGAERELCLHPLRYGRKDDQAPLREIASTAVSLLDILATGRRYGAGLPAGGDEREEALLAVTDRILESTRFAVEHPRSDWFGRLINRFSSHSVVSVEAEAREGLREFSEQAHVLQGEEFQKSNREFYSNVLLGFRMPVAEFTAAMCLIHIQRFLNAWVVGPWWTDAPADLAIYMGQVLEKKEFRNSFRRLAPEMANTEFRAATEQLHSAQDAAPMARFPSALLVAHHRFLLAEWFREQGLAHGVKEPEFQFLAEEAAEGVSSTRTALASGVLFLSRPFEDFARWSPALQPLLPRMFREILMEHRRTLAMERAEIESGAERLRSFQPDLSAAMAFEESWIDEALVRAYEKLGNEQGRIETEARIAGRGLLRRIGEV